MSLKLLLQKFLDGLEKKLSLEDPLGAEFLALRDFSQQIRSGDDYPATAGATEENIRKNRYKDIRPFDHTRVTLSPNPGVAGSDYINANFIQGHHGRASYIAAQGPMPHTVDDFWAMLWQYDIVVVVMACNEREGGKAKCERYWPYENEEKVFRDITVKLISEERVSQDFLVRKLSARCGKEEHIVEQFHYLEWPDHGAPESCTSLLDMIAMIRVIQPGDPHPVVVHCSAGCGRTGTICAVDYSWNILKAGALKEDFDIFTIIKEMRTQRPSLVQTKDQYVLVHQAVAELFERHLDMIRDHLYENVAIESGNQNKMIEETIYEDIGGACSRPGTQGDEEDVYVNADELKKKKRRSSDAAVMIMQETVNAMLTEEACSVPDKFYNVSYRLSNIYSVKTGATSAVSEKPKPPALPEKTISPPMNADERKSVPSIKSVSEVPERKQLPPNPEKTVSRDKPKPPALPEKKTPTPVTADQWKTLPLKVELEVPEKKLLPPLPEKHFANKDDRKSAPTQSSSGENPHAVIGRKFSVDSNERRKLKSGTADVSPTSGDVGKTSGKGVEKPAKPGKLPPSIGEKFLKGMSVRAGKESDRPSPSPQEKQVPEQTSSVSELKQRLQKGGGIVLPSGQSSDAFGVHKRTPSWELSAKTDPPQTQDRLSKHQTGDRKKSDSSTPPRSPNLGKEEKRAPIPTPRQKILSVKETFEPDNASSENADSKRSPLTPSRRSTGRAFVVASASTTNSAGYEIVDINPQFLPTRNSSSVSLPQATPCFESEGMEVPQFDGEASQVVPDDPQQPTPSPRRFTLPRSSTNDDTYTLVMKKKPELDSSGSADSLDGGESLYDTDLEVPPQVLKRTKLLPSWLDEDNPYVVLGGSTPNLTGFGSADSLDGGESPQVVKKTKLLPNWLDEDNPYVVLGGSTPNLTGFGEERSPHGPEASITVERCTKPLPDWLDDDENPYGTVGTALPSSLPPEQLSMGTPASKSNETAEKENVHDYEIKVERRTKPLPNWLDNENPYGTVGAYQRSQHTDEKAQVTPSQKSLRNRGTKKIVQRCTKPLPQWLDDESPYATVGTTQRKCKESGNGQVEHPPSTDDIYECIWHAFDESRDDQTAFVTRTKPLPDWLIEKDEESPYGTVGELLINQSESSENKSKSDENIPSTCVYSTAGPEYAVPDKPARPPLIPAVLETWPAGSKAPPTLPVKDFNGNQVATDLTSSSSDKSNDAAKESRPNKFKLLTTIKSKFQSGLGKNDQAMDNISVKSDDSKIIPLHLAFPNRIGKPRGARPAPWDK